LARHLQSRRSDDVALDVVDAAAERVDLGRSAGLLQPPLEDGARRPGPAENSIAASIDGSQRQAAKGRRCSRSAGRTAHLGST